MARPTREDINSWIDFASESPANKKAIQDARDAAALECLSGDGGKIVNGSGNGVAFASMDGMTFQEKFTLFGLILKSVKLNTRIPSSTYVRII